MVVVNVLINEEKYIDQYVALKDFNDNTICGSGDTPDKAYAEAEKNGCLNPVIIFASSKELSQVY
jgi:hypothetical protein